MHHAVFFLLLWPFLWPDAQCANDFGLFIQANVVTITTALLLTTDPASFGLNLGHGWTAHRHKQPQTCIKRTRKSVSETLAELGSGCIRRSHRMEERSFWKLCRLLRPHLKQKKRKDGKKKQSHQRNGAKNGIVPPATKLSVALRWFSGGSACDISVAHGTSHSQVFCCVWAVVDAVNRCPELGFNCPSDHECRTEENCPGLPFQKQS